MGTNYYAQPKGCPNACDHCEQRETVHIGKSGRMLQGYPTGAAGDPTPILSWRDWKDWLPANSVRIVDEYGREMTLEELVETFESSSREDRERQYRWVVEHGYGGRGMDWLDDSGFSFTSSEFS